MGLPPKNLYNKRFENMSIFRFGLHPYKLATLRATIGLIVTSCYRIKKTYQNQGICYVTKRLWPAINFLMWKWPATLKRLGRHGLDPKTKS